MKHSVRSIPVILALAFFSGMISCEKSPEEPTPGMAGFSLDLPVDQPQLKSDPGFSDSVSIAWHLLVSIEDENGQLVVSDELVPIYRFGTGFISDKLELDPGSYRLVKFMVIDPSGEVVFAAPLEGAPLAYLVNDPLPIPFNIRSGQTTMLYPEVLPVGSHPPGDFGYIAFGMQVVRPLDFYVVCVLENPWSEAPIQLTTAKLTVFGPGNWHYTFRLEARLNHLVIRGGAGMYTFLLEKEGYPPQKMQFPAWQLAATSPDNPLVLKIPWNTSQWKLLVLQPGPEKGTDAMISNLDPETNFGDHPFFEATFLSEPVLTVMRTNRSLIRFPMEELPEGAQIKKVQLQLFYSGQPVWDSTSVPGSTGNNDEAAVGVVLQQITGPWKEEDVTWNTSPPASTYHQVYLPLFLSTQSAGHILVDVTRLYLNESAVSAAHYGMLLRQYPQDFFPGVRFASSDFPVPEMRPMLKVYYTTN